MQLQVAAGSLVQLRMVGLILIFQLQKPLVTDHIGRKLSGCLLVDVVHGDLVELMDPAGRILTGSHLESSGSLDILPVKVKMSQHAPAVPGGQKAVPDKARQLLMDLILIQRTEGQIDKYDRVPLVFHRAGAGDDLFHIAADGAQGKIFRIQNAYVDQDAQIVVGGKPSGSIQLAADFHVVRAGRGKERQKDLMELVGTVAALHHIGGEGVGDHFRQIFQQKSEGVVKGDFSLGDHQPEDGLSGSWDIDAELRRGHLIAGIIEVSGPVKRLLIVDILLEGVDDRLRGFGGAENRVLELSVGELFGCDDREILAGHHHGIGDHRVGQIQKLLDGSVGQPGIHQTLIPAVITVVELLQKGQQFSRCDRLRKETVAWLAGLGQMGAPAGEQDHIFRQASHRQRQFRVVNQVDDPVVGKERSFVVDGIFQDRIPGKPGRDDGLRILFLKMPGDQ